MAKRRGGTRAYKPKIGIKEIEAFVEESRERLQVTGRIDDPWLFVAASHALDFYEVGRAARAKLDFTGASKGVDLAAMANASQLQLEGKAEPEVRQTLAKRVAAYMMIQVYNDLSAIGADVSFECGESSFALVSKVRGGTPLRYDFLRRAALAVQGLRLNEGRDRGSVAGTLQPFFQSLFEEFLLPQFKALGALPRGL